MKKVIKYTSKNGYTGVLYGQSSMSIYDKDGKEVLHTGSRAINTYDELVELVDEHPKFRQMLFEHVDELINDDDDYDI